jgi:hypothetical protein
MPVLKDGVKAALDTRYFSDLDLVPVKGGTVPVDGRNIYLIAATLVLPLVLLAAGVIAYRRLRAGRRVVAVEGFALPGRLTPLNAVMTLRRVQETHGAALGDARLAELERDIALLELKYFGPANGDHSTVDLSDVLHRWASTVAKS